MAKLKEPGVVAIARHALAPGTGDPEVVDLNDRSTQRNLSEEGREQSRRMGELLRKAGIEEAYLFTSQWARCRDTAELMDLGDVKDLPALNSFFEHPERREPQIAELQEWLEDPPGDKPVILITHQVVITALTGVFPSSGEIILIQKDANGSWAVAGRVRTLQN